MAPSWHQQTDGAVTETLRVKLEELQASDVFARLGVAHDAEKAVIRATFLSATKTFHPSRFGRRPEETRRLANEVFLLIKAAYVQLSSDTGRVKALKTVGAAIGADEPAKAMPAPASESPARAVSPVVNISPSEPEPAVQRNRAATAGREREERFAAAVAMVSQGLYKNARGEFEQLAAANPNMTKFRVYLHYARGKQHEHAKQHDAARREYEAASELHPRFFLATKALEQLPGGGGGTSVQAAETDDQGPDSPKDAPGKRGLFSRLFRK